MEHGAIEPNFLQALFIPYPPILNPSLMESQMSASARFPFPYRPEADIVARYLQRLAGALDWADAAQSARPWVQAVRGNPPPFWAMESLLKEFPISTAEGLALMRLAEALLRVPDAE